MDTLLLSLLPFAVPALGICACVILFLTLKSDMRSGDQKLLSRHEALESEWKARFEELEKKHQELAGQVQVFALPAQPKALINLTRRSQALQLHRQGEPPEQIAAALGLPRNEVDLLLKVNALVLKING